MNLMQQLYKFQKEAEDEKLNRQGAIDYVAKNMAEQNRYITPDEIKETEEKINSNYAFLNARLELERKGVKIDKKVLHDLIVKTKSNTHATFDETDLFADCIKELKDMGAIRAPEYSEDDNYFMSYFLEELLKKVGVEKSTASWMSNLSSNDITISERNSIYEMKDILNSSLDKSNFNKRKLIQDNSVKENACKQIYKLVSNIFEYLIKFDNVFVKRDLVPYEEFSEVFNDLYSKMVTFGEVMQMC